jgi:hypothetical protein
MIEHDTRSNVDGYKGKVEEWPEPGRQEKRFTIRIRSRVLQGSTCSLRRTPCGNPLVPGASSKSGEAGGYTQGE